MPLLIIAAGILLAVAAYQNNISAMTAQAESDIVGWFPWAIAIIAIGILQYIPNFEKPARLLMGLVVVVIFITNGSGFFQQLQAAGNALSQQSTTANTSKAQASTASSATVSAEKQVSAMAGGSGGSTGGNISSGTPGGILGSIPFLGSIL